MFLETVKGFPLVLHYMTPYYAANPGIRTQSLAILFPFLEGMLPFLLKNDSGSPFTGAAVTKPTTRPPRNSPNRRPNRGLDPPTARSHSPAFPHNTRWSPQGPAAYSASSSASPSPDPSQAEIIRLHGIIADMVGSPSRDAHFGMPVPPTEYPNATLFSESRPRAHYCWLHGWNNTHPGTTCKVMCQNPAYTHVMKHATGPNGTDGNPRVGVPVRFSRPHFLFLPLPFVCPPCLPLQTPPTDTFSPPLRQAIKDSPEALPNDAIRAGAPTKLSAPFMLQAEGHNPPATRVRDAAPTLPHLEPVAYPGLYYGVLQVPPSTRQTLDLKLAMF
jgi:hypothetical protein